MRFGDFPYGNVPLDLPSGWEPSDRGAPGSDPAVLEPEGWGDQEVEPERLFWFRWITGHQISFLCWRQAGQSLIASQRGGVDQHEDLRRTAIMLRGATAMFVYTSTCPRELYHALMRPVMTLWHSAFTGRWAADYEPLPGLVSGLRAGPRLPAATEVQTAFSESRHVHIAAAQKLVPGGKSVLQQFVRENSGAPPIDPATATFLYDSFFLVRRLPVTHCRIASALRDRVAAVLTDLELNGLYPRRASSGHEAPEGSRGETFRARERDIPPVLRAVARACGGPACSAGAASPIPVGVSVGI